MKVYGEQEGIYYFLNDHLGTPHIIIDSSGEIAWHAAYLPFGQAQILKDTITNNFRFPGQYYDSETGFHYNYHRYYEPKIGRYLRSDPVGIDGGLNLYLYAEANPINIVDPKGLAGIGGGAYYGGGAEGSYSRITCCEKNTLYEVKILSICGGVGIGLKGSPPVSVTAFGISSRSGCPRTRYYFKHESVFLLRSVNVQLDRQGPSAGVDAGIFGISTIWAFCSDTVISKKMIGCCNN